MTGNGNHTTYSCLGDGLLLFNHIIKYIYIYIHKSEIFKPDYLWGHEEANDGVMIVLLTLFSVVYRFCFPNYNQHTGSARGAKLILHIFLSTVNQACRKPHLLYSWVFFVFCWVTNGFLHLCFLLEGVLSGTQGSHNSEMSQVALSENMVPQFQWTIII